MSFPLGVTSASCLPLLGSEFGLTLPFRSILAVPLAAVSPSLSLVAVSVSTSRVKILFGSSGSASGSFPSWETLSLIVFAVLYSSAFVS